jgi:hypothetical protein
MARTDPLAALRGISNFDTALAFFSDKKGVAEVRKVTAALQAKIDEFNEGLGNLAKKSMADVHLADAEQKALTAGVKLRDAEAGATEIVQTARDAASSIEHDANALAGEVETRTAEVKERERQADHRERGLDERGARLTAKEDSNTQETARLAEREGKVTERESVFKKASEMLAG